MRATSGGQGTARCAAPGPRKVRRTSGKNMEQNCRKTKKVPGQGSLGGRPPGAENLRTGNLSTAAPVLRRRTRAAAGVVSGGVWRGEALSSVTGGHWQLMEGTGSCRTGRRREPGLALRIEPPALLGTRAAPARYAECKCVCIGTKLR